MPKPLFVLLTVLLVVAGARAALFIYAPSKPLTLQDSTSPFLLAYSPGKVVTSYYVPNQPCKGGHSLGGGSDGRNNLNFETDCIIERDREQQFVHALRAELLASLGAAHARLTKQEQHADGGFRCAYRSGNDTGTVTIEPLEHPFVQHDKPLPEALEDVRVRLTVEEHPTTLFDFLR